MTCSTGLDLLVDFLEGELDPAVRRAVAEHVAGCERCAAFVASYRATPEILRRATASTLPTDLADSLLNAVRRQFGEEGPTGSDGG